MARSLNRVQLVGNLGKDPELRATPSGKSVCTLNIATTESYKNSSGEWQDNTEWHRVVLWERLADVAAQYLKQGNKVFIEGRLKTRSYEQDGITKYMTEIIANNMIMMGGAGGEGSGGGYSQGSKPATANDSGYNKSDRPQIDENDFDTSDDDDVPF